MDAFSEVPGHLTWRNRMSLQKGRCGHLWTFLISATLFLSPESPPQTPNSAERQGHKVGREKGQLQLGAHYLFFLGHLAGWLAEQARSASFSPRFSSQLCNDNQRRVRDMHQCRKSACSLKNYTARWVYFTTKIICVYFRLVFLFFYIENQLVGTASFASCISQSTTLQHS